MPRTSGYIDVQVVGGLRSGEMMAVREDLRVVRLDDPVEPLVVPRAVGFDDVSARTTYHIKSYEVVKFCVDYPSRDFVYYLIPYEMRGPGACRFILETLGKAYANQNAKPE